MKFGRRSFAIGVAVALAAIAYFTFYIKLPRWIDRGGFHYEHLAIFDKDFEPILFAPAGYLHAFLIRFGPKTFPDAQCGQFVVLQTDRKKFSFRATDDPKPNYAHLDWDADILEFALRHQEQWEQVTLPDASKHDCKYGDCDLEKAEEFLANKYPRPYTIGHALRWYDQACDEETRIHLLALLAASRDPRAVLALAAALRSPSLNIRVLAVSVFNRYFVSSHCGTSGSTETEFIMAFDWLEANLNAIQKAVRNLPEDL
jgi:hypothetical protein